MMGSSHVAEVSSLSNWAVMVVTSGRATMTGFLFSYSQKRELLMLFIMHGSGNAASSAAVNFVHIVWRLFSI